MNADLNRWVEECAELTQPQKIHVCDGSDAENQRLIERMLDDKTLFALNQKHYPGCYLHRSHPNDVARVEQLTFICSEKQDDAGPTNNWMDPWEAKARVGELFRGSMRGRTMYVLPYVMGPPGSPLSRVGVQITDSPYVVASMRIMTRMGRVALDQMDRDGAFIPGLHSVGQLDPNRRYILHFPQERLIWSFGSGYGGNALLGKKCFALRIASVMARDEGWMAEHMLILELEDPYGEKVYFAAAFPSACGKTNLAMLVSPLEREGYRVRTIGDDIAWMYIGEDGRLWAINPEAGFFGVVPGTNMKTNPNALMAAKSNSLYTNVAVSDDGMPWWEGHDDPPYEPLTDWRGRRPWSREEMAAHPNSRFTAPAKNCPSMSAHWQEPQGVPISGIIFGGRRTRTVPLVFESFSWQHGTFLGAAMTSNTTSAAVGTAGVLRHDPMSMLPFCGYHMADYWQHWLDMGQRISQPPVIFHVNWFRQGADGEYLWPGFGENVRVLIWMLGRIKRRAEAKETPIGYVPTRHALHMEGLEIRPEVMDQLLDVNPQEWQEELPYMEEFFRKIGDRVPAALWKELAGLRQRLASACTMYP
jgi:phosphoenolpyruvate carboxykinase (GTP)